MIERRVHVTASRSYDVIIGEGILDRAGELTSGLGLGKKVMIVSDDNVAPLYLARLRRSLEAAGKDCSEFVFAHGEQSKCADTFLSILSALASNSFDRSDSVFALGGGVVGDISGFCASAYMRGIRFVQVPTTLLAATDSSVGGKCAIDIPEGKNLVGAFWQPSAVICDVRTLDTLTDDFFADGMAEVIKYAMIRDASLCELIADGKAKENICELIERCVTIKRDVVAEDERDTGVRAILNFGHTLAHAIEAESGFTVTHGRAVGMGMAAVSAGCVRLGLCPHETAEKLSLMMAPYGLSTVCPYPIDVLAEHIKRDKKCSSGDISLVLSRGVGSCEVKRMPISDALALLG